MLDILKVIPQWNSTRTTSNGNGLEFLQIIFAGNHIVKLSCSQFLGVRGYQS